MHARQEGVRQLAKHRKVKWEGPELQQALQKFGKDQLTSRHNGGLEMVKKKRFSWDEA
jgi:hypothetical protein